MKTTETEKKFASISFFWVKFNSIQFNLIEIFFFGTNEKNRLCFLSFFLYHNDNDTINTNKQQQQQQWDLSNLNNKYGPKRKKKEKKELTFYCSIRGSRRAHIIDFVFYLDQMDTLCPFSFHYFIFTRFFLVIPIVHYFMCVCFTFLINWVLGSLLVSIKIFI